MAQKRGSVSLGAQTSTLSPEMGLKTGADARAEASEIAQKEVLNCLPYFK
jgi:hypothetical protein